MKLLYTNEDVAFQLENESLMYSDAYADFLMENYIGDRPICNGDMLLELMERSVMFNEFLLSIEK
jgi:hypothetical protein